MSAPTRIFHVSDVHFGREDPAAVAWFEERVREERPDAVIMTGDLTMRARASEWDAAAQWLGRLNVPVTVEVGNHDLPYFNPLARIFMPYRRFKRVEKAIERPLNLPGLWLVPLRTATRAQWRLNWSWGVVRRKNLDEALDLLNACPPDHVAVVAAHHPLIDNEGEPPSKGATLGGRKALAELAAAGADVVLSGHVHDPFDVMWKAGGRQVRLIGAGTLSERLRGAPPSFNELRLNGGTLESRVRSMVLQRDPLGRGEARFQ